MPTCRKQSLRDPQRVLDVLWPSQFKGNERIQIAALLRNSLSRSDNTILMGAPLPVMIIVPLGSISGRSFCQICFEAGQKGWRQ